MVSVSFADDEIRARGRSPTATRSSQRKGSLHASRINLKPARFDDLPRLGDGARIGLERPGPGVVGCDLSRGHAYRIRAHIRREGRDKGRDYLRVRIDTEQRIKRGRDTAVTKLTYGTIETPDGQVLRLDTLTDVGQGKIRATAM